MDGILIIIETHKRRKIKIEQEKVHEFEAARVGGPIENPTKRPLLLGHLALIKQLQLNLLIPW